MGLWYYCYKGSSGNTANMRFLQYLFVARRKSHTHTLPDYSFTGVGGEQAYDETLVNDSFWQGVWKCEDVYSRQNN